MPNQPRFPAKDADFNDYLNRAIPHLNANAARLNLSAANGNRMNELKTLWDEKYPKSQNPDMRTRTITAEKNDTRTLMEETLRDIFDDIPESSLTQQDRETLNLRERDTEPTPRGKINEAPDVNLIPLAGGRMQVRCRIDQDATRASMHPLADAVEVKFKIVGINDPAPALVSDLTNTFMSKKSLFTMDAGIDNAGRRFYAACRWVNISNPANSGPYSTIHNAVILG